MGRRRTGSSLFRHRIIDSRSSSFYSRSGRVSLFLPPSVYLSFFVRLARSLCPSFVPAFPPAAPCAFLFYRFGPGRRDRRARASQMASPIPISKRPRAAHMGPELFEVAAQQRKVSNFRVRSKVSPRPAVASRETDRSDWLPAHNRSARRGEEGNEREISNARYDRCKFPGRKRRTINCGPSAGGEDTVLKFRTYLEAVEPSATTAWIVWLSDKISCSGHRRYQVTFFFLRFHAV